MAVAGQNTTVSGFDAALKEVYAGPIREQLNKKTRLLDLFTKGDIEQYEWEGRVVVFALHKSRNAGVKANAEGGTLPVAGSQGFANLKVPMRYIEGRIQLTAQVMKASRSNRGAFARAMDVEQKGLVDDLARLRNRMLAYFGQGTLATLSAGTSTTTVTVTNPGNVSGSVNPTRFLRVGQMIAITDATGATLRGVQTITAINASTGVINVDAAFGNSNPVSTDLISLGSNVNSPGSTNVSDGSSYNAEPMGLLGLVDSTTFVTTIHGLDRSANAFFQSIVLQNVGALSPDLIQRYIDNVEEVSGEVIDMFASHPSVRREIIKLTEADRRYNTSTLINPDAGTKAGAFKVDQTFNGIPVKIDKDIAYGMLFGLSKENLYWIPEVEGEWVDEDGNVLFRNPNVDAFEARYRVFENFLTDRGNAHFRLDGITATVSSGVFADA